MEAFDLAVGLWPVWTGAFGCDLECVQAVAPGVALVAGAVVGDDPLGVDTDRLVPGRSSSPEPGRSGGLLIGEDLRVRNAGAVVDCRVQFVPAFRSTEEITAV
mgnify:CR=1 FL=1